MSVDSINALQTMLISGGSLLIGFLAKALWDGYKAKSLDTESEVKILTKEIHTLTLGILELKIELKHVSDSLRRVDQLEVDVNGLGQKVRDMS